MEGGEGPMEAAAGEAGGAAGEAGGAGAGAGEAPSLEVRPIYCNFGFDANPADVRSAFEAVAPVVRVDMKNRYAFVFMETTEGAEKAVEALHETDFGPPGPDGRLRRLVVTFARVRTPPAPPFPKPPLPRLPPHPPFGASPPLPSSTSAG